MHVLTNLRNTLDLATNIQAAYEAASPNVRRQFNQAIFKRLYICDDGDVAGELAEPFHTLLNPQLHHRVLTAPNKPSDSTDTTEEDWQAWESSFNENTHAAQRLVGAGTTRRPLGRLGLTNESMVEHVPPSTGNGYSTLGSTVNGLPCGEFGSNGTAFPLVGAMMDGDLDRCDYRGVCVV